MVYPLVLLAMLAFRCFRLPLARILFFLTLSGAYCLTLEYSNGLTPFLIILFCLGVSSKEATSNPHDSIYVNLIRLATSWAIVFSSS